MDYTFSSIGEEWVIRYYISRSDLRRWNCEKEQYEAGNYEDFTYQTTPSEKNRRHIIHRVLKTGIIKGQ
jgi:hypothetical protein